MASSDQFLRVGNRLVPVDSTTARLHAAGFGHRARPNPNRGGRDIFRLDTGEVVAEGMRAQDANEWLAGLLAKESA